MGINLELAIKHMYDLRTKKVTYSMTGSRTGVDGTADCSGAIYAALVKGGGPTLKYPFSTESEHDYLLKNGFELIAFNKSWNMQRGDIGVLGIKGQSAFAGGHTFMAIDGTNVIHCNYDHNGVTVNNENTMPYSMGFYIYRQKGGSKPIEPSKPPKNSGYFDTGNYFEALQNLETRNRSWSKVDKTWTFPKGAKFAVRDKVIDPKTGAVHARVAGLEDTYVTMAKSHVKPQ